MRRLAARMCWLFILLFGLSVPATANAHVTGTERLHQSGTDALDFPTVDPNYTYDQLFYMVTNFQQREAGFPHNLPPNTSGHDQFAFYWAQEMVSNLQGFQPQIRRDPFAIQGWLNHRATVPAFNVEVSVPGVDHPDQVVVIGCHYDGEAVSTQSAYDDASGCAIELGIAQALGNYWRQHHLFPARTLRFVIFDAEEQGLYGSWHVLDSTMNGDIPDIVAMFNEEQNGIAYPLRYLGRLANPQLPFTVFMSPLRDTPDYPLQHQLSSQQRTNILHFRALMQQAVPAVFARFRALGFQMLSYHNNGQDLFQPVFTPDQLSHVRLIDDTLGSSDQLPFTLAGVPCATFIGDFSYYGNFGSKPTPWAYPFDQSTDTIQLMNTFADGSSQKSHALSLALALPGMLTAWMLNRPDVLGTASADQNPIAAISDIGPVQVGQTLSLDAGASFDPNHDGAPLAYTWDFGDGTTASGIAVQHRYATARTYTLTLTVTSNGAVRRINKQFSAVQHPTTYSDFYTRFYHEPYVLLDGRPPTNPAVVLPIANDHLSDAVEEAGKVAIQSSQAAFAPSYFFSGPLIGIGLGVVVLALAGIVVWRGRKRSV